MPKTIHEHGLVTSAAAADEVLIWRAANSDTKRIAKSNLLGGSLTGGGTIATGGFTGTLPATGTIALRSVAQTWSAKQTFGAGIDFGQGSALDYYQGSSWSPVVRDSTVTGGGNIATATKLGIYSRIGALVTVWGSILNISTAGMTAGNPITIQGLPFPAFTFTNYAAIGTAHVSRFTFASYVVPIVSSGNSYVQFLNLLPGTTPESFLLFSNIASSTLTDLNFTLTYLTEA